MHVHASDRKLTEAGSGKFFVKANGDTILQNRGRLNDREIVKIQAFIKDNYKEIIKDGRSTVNTDFTVQTIKQN